MIQWIEVKTPDYPADVTCLMPSAMMVVESIDKALAMFTVNRDTTISLLHIYDNPPEWPGKIVVREQVANKKQIRLSPFVVLFNDVDSARREMPSGRSAIPALPMDTNTLIETWLEG